MHYFNIKNTSQMVFTNRICFNYNSNRFLENESIIYFKYLLFIQHYITFNFKRQNNQLSISNFFLNIQIAKLKFHNFIEIFK